MTPSPQKIKSPDTPGGFIGLVTHNHLGHGAPVYSEHGHPHLHQACQVCGDVIETSASTVDGLAEELARTRGFTLDPTHVALPGRCSDCDTPDTGIEER